MKRLQKERDEYIMLLPLGEDVVDLIKDHYFDIGRLSWDTKITEVNQEYHQIYIWRNNCVKFKNPICHAALSPAFNHRDFAYKSNYGWNYHYWDHIRTLVKTFIKNNQPNYFMRFLGSDKRIYNRIMIPSNYRQRYDILPGLKSEVSN